MKEISEKQLIKWSVRLVLKFKTNKSLKLLLVDVKANNSILMGFENGRDGTKQAKMPYFHCGLSS